MSGALVRCQDWVREVVVGWDLCPWAAAPLAAGQVRWRKTERLALEELVAEVLFEARILAESDEIRTGLLVLSNPLAMTEFVDLLELIEVSDAVLEACDLGEWVQLVGFHPHFRYEGTDPDDPANGTNRSPAPMVHLLRRAEVEELAVDGVALAERNADRLRTRAARSSKRES